MFLIREGQDHKRPNLYIQARNLVFKVIHYFKRVSENGGPVLKPCNIRNKHLSIFDKQSLHHAWIPVQNTWSSIFKISL